jgi:hypothetical protein
MKIEIQIGHSAVRSFSAGGIPGKRANSVGVKTIGFKLSELSLEASQTCCHGQSKPPPDVDKNSKPRASRARHSVRKKRDKPKSPSIHRAKIEVLHKMEKSTQPLKDSHNRLEDILKIAKHDQFGALPLTPPQSNLISRVQDSAQERVYAATVAARTQWRAAVRD